MERGLLVADIATRSLKAKILLQLSIKNLLVSLVISTAGRIYIVIL